MYFGILEADKFLGEEMKLKVSKEYSRRLKKVLKSKLNGGNLVQGVNTSAVSLLRYSAAFIIGRKCELQAIDKKLEVVYNIWKIASEVKGIGLITIEDCGELAVRGLEVYVHGSEERQIQAARGDRVDGLEAANVLKKAKKEKRLQDWKEKALYGQYLRQTKEVRSEQSCVWLQNGDLKRETESLIVAAQNQSIRTNLVKD